MTFTYALLGPSFLWLSLCYSHVSMQIWISEQMRVYKTISSLLTLPKGI